MAGLDVSKAGILAVARKLADSPDSAKAFLGVLALLLLLMLAVIFGASFLHSKDEDLQLLKDYPAKRADLAVQVMMNG